MQDGSAIEVATVGNEGLVGHTVTTGGKKSPNRLILQIADGALRIEAGALRDEAARGGPAPGHRLNGPLTPCRPRGVLSAWVSRRPSLRRRGPVAGEDPDGRIR